MADVGESKQVLESSGQILIDKLTKNDGVKNERDT